MIGYLTFGRSGTGLLLRLKLLRLKPSNESKSKLVAGLKFRLSKQRLTL
jgi:hypothetical protein